MSYWIFGLTVFVSAIIGNIVGHYLFEWIEDMRFQKAFEPLFKRE